MKKVTSKTITPEQIKAVNQECYGDESEDAMYFPLSGYAFYYNQLMINGLDLCDADRYANLNTILGYDVGIVKFRCLDGWLWNRMNYDLMELSGSEDDKALLQEATEKTKTKPLDYSKWRNYVGRHYTYSYFEKGVDMTKEE